MISHQRKERQTDRQKILHIGLVFPFPKELNNVSIYEYLDVVLCYCKYQGRRHDDCSLVLTGGARVNFLMVERSVYCSNGARTISCGQSIDCFCVFINVKLKRVFQRENRLIIFLSDMTSTNEERQRETLIIQDTHESVSPLSNRFLIAHSSPVHESQIDTVTRLHEDSFQSSSSTSNSKSSSSTTSRSSRLQYLLMHQHPSAVNSPLMYSRCTSLGSLASYDIRSSCNESYTSECSSVKPSGIISPSDIPDSPPCEPEVIEEELPLSRPINRTLTLNTTSSHNRTTMMSETVIEKTFIYNQNQHQQHSINQLNQNENDLDDDEHLDEVIVYAYETTEINERSSYENQFIFDDDSYRVFNTQTDETDSFIDESVEQHTSFPELVEVGPHENLSVITEESSFLEDLNSNEETNSIRILYDLIKKPHWTRKANQQHLSRTKSLSNPSTFLSSHSIEDNGSISSDPSSLSLDSISGNQTDDEDEYDQEKGRELIQRLIEETLARRSVNDHRIRFIFVD